jgi:hypothetical protein
MDDLGVVGRVARAMVATLPADTAILLLSVAALLTLLRATRRVPLNSAFARKPEPTPDHRATRLDEESGRDPDRPSSTLRRV